MKLMKKLLSTLTAAAIGATMCSAMAAGMPAAMAASSAVALVEDMGLGWNLGNTLDSTNSWTSNPSPSDIETAWGNPVTTEAMIQEIKKAGFKTVRIPVTWWDMTGATGTASMDAFDGEVAEKFLARVKEVVDYCIDNDMYAIINTHHDEEWQKDTSKIDIFKKLWGQIAEYFKDYDQHLVFEGMNEVSFTTADAMTYNQAFVDTVRATGGNNTDRLLICTANSNNTDAVLSSAFSMPTDSSNMLAVSVHYYEPPTFCVADMSSSWGHRETWGTATDLTTVENDFEDLKEKFTDNGVGVIIGEYGVVNADKYGINSTNYNKDQDSIELFLQTVASTAYNMDGICPIVWDDSNSGTITLFNRETLSWYEPSIQQLYMNIANGGDVDPDLEKTDRLSFAAADIVDPESTTGDLLIDLKPYKDLGVNLTSVVIEYDISGNRASYGTGGAVQYNIVDADEQYHWAYQPYSFVVGESVTTVNIPETTVVTDEDGNEYEGPIDMDYLKIGHWFDWSDPSGGTVEWSYENITLIFDDYFYVEGGETTTEPPAETTTEGTTTTTATTEAPVETTTTAVDVDPYGYIWLAGQAGTYQFWNASDAGVNPIAITGNGTYTATFEITEGDGTGSIECLILDSDINCYQFLPEDYDGDDRVGDCGVTFNIESVSLDGVEIEYTGPTDGSMTYGNDGVSLCRNILNTWTSPKVSDIDGSEVTLTDELVVTFTVSGLPTENPPATTSAEETTTTETTTTTTTTTEAVPTETTTTNTDLTALYGDMNLDGRIDIVDAVLLNRMLAGQVQTNDQQRLNGDLDQDGSLSSNDASVLLRFLVNLISSIPV